MQPVVPWGGSWENQNQVYVTQLLVTQQLSFPEATEGMGGGSVANRTGIADDSSSSPSTHTWRLTPACSSSSRGSYVLYGNPIQVQIPRPLPTIHIQLT